MAGIETTTGGNLYQPTFKLQGCPVEQRGINAAINSPLFYLKIHVYLGGLLRGIAVRLRAVKVFLCAKVNGGYLLRQGKIGQTSRRHQKYFFKSASFGSDVICALVVLKSRYKDF